MTDRLNGICRLLSRAGCKRIRRVVPVSALDPVALTSGHDADRAVCPVASGVGRTVGQTILRMKFFVDSRKRVREIFHLPWE